MTDTHGSRYYWVLLIIVPLLFFWKTWAQGLLPVPTDSLVGLYHPFRDYFADQSPNGVPYKNYLLTDPVLQQYPWKWLAMEQWKQGKIPWENPYNFSGTPLLANPQSGSLYPLNILFLLGPFHWMWTLYIVLQPILAGLFMAFFLHSSRFTLFASVFGGLVWAFSSFNLVWLEWGNIGHAGLWLPLALLASNKLQVTSDKQDKKYQWHVLFQFSLLMSFLAGHPQVFLYVFLSTTLYWFLQIGFSRRSVFLFIVHCSLFIVLASPQLIPTFRFVQSSNREAEQQDVLSREGFFIELKHLVQFISPDFFGNPATGNYRGEWNYAEQIVYVGIIPLVVAILGGLGRFQPQKDSPREDSPYKDSPFSDVRTFAVLLVVGSLMLSVRSPIAEVPYRLNIPVLQDLQPTRLSFLTTFGLSILAAFGFERMVKKSEGHEKSLFIIGTATASVLFALLIVSSKFSPAEKLISQRNLIFPTILLAAGIGGIWGIRMIGESWKFNKRWISLLTTCYLLLATIFDLFRFGWKFTPFSPVEYLYPITPTIVFLQDHMGPDDRYMTLDRRILPPNANIMYGLKSIEGYDPLYSKEYAQLVTEMEGGRSSTELGNFGRIVRPMNFRSPVAENLHVRFVLSLVDMEEHQLQKVFQEGETRIYERLRKDGASMNSN